MRRSSPLYRLLGFASRRRSSGGGERLSRGTRLYLGGVATATAAAAVSALLFAGSGWSAWPTFLVLAASAAASSWFVVPTGHNHGFHVAIVFIIAAVLLLPPEFVALVPVVQHLPDWIRRRYPWYIRLFNAANYTLNALAAWGVAHLVFQAFAAHAALRLALSGVAASVTFVVLNHVLLAGVLLIARRVSIRESRLLSATSLWIDISLAALGVGLAAFWDTDRYLIPIILVPLILVHRSFALLSLLRQSEERFRAIFESTAVGIQLTGLDGALLDANSALEELLAYRDGELANATLAEITHPDDLAEDRRLAIEMIEGRRESYQHERRLLRKDGAEISANVTSSVVRDPDGRPTFAIGMVQDVTRRKQLEEQLRHAQKMEAIGGFAGAIAHDFNNVLTVIETYSSFALQRLGDRDESVREDVEEIRKAGQQAASLTRKLLAFSRRQVLQPCELDLNEIVADTENMLRRLLGEQVEIVTSLHESLGRVRADPDEIVQVLINLAVNARDAMPDGGTLTIETSNVELQRPEIRNGVEAPPGSYVRFIVRDSGVGIEPAIQSRIFEPFFTTKARGKGTGLGLSTVYGIVAQSGGYLFVASGPGEGAELAIYLPRVAAGERKISEPSTPGDGQATDATVLLVEDEDRVRDAIRRILSDAGHTVLEAFDGAQALRVAERHSGRIDLLVTDVVIAHLSGPELAARLSSDRPDLKVLFVSGYTAENDVSEHLSADGFEFLQKPFTEKALREKARALLDGAQGLEVAAPAA
jgi:PAS domain S-box-containing protein